MIKLYQDNGYFNARAVNALGLTFVYVIAARGTGKSFNVFDIPISAGEEFIYLRRSQPELDNALTDTLNPFNRYNLVKKRKIRGYKISKDISGFKDENQKICVNFALSTFVNVRGLDAGDKKTIIFDEIIPEAHKRRVIKDEATAFSQLYESLNRNRELDGEPPLRVWFLGNSDTLTAPMLSLHNLVPIIEMLYAKKREYYIDRERSLGVFLLQNSPISEAKRKTALYKSGIDKGYIDMAIDNKFAELDDRRTVRRENLKEYRALCTIDGLCFYAHKNCQRLYVTRARSGTLELFTTAADDVLRFKKKYDYIFGFFLQNNIFFDSIATKIKFMELYDI